MISNWHPRRLWGGASPQPTAAGLLGKVPSDPDFVREGHCGQASDALDRWLVAGRSLLGANMGTGTAWPRLQFCGYASRKTALLGVLAPSQDSAGREFPVAVFQELELRVLGARFGELLWRFENFFEAAGALIAQLPSLARDELPAALHALPTTQVEAGPPLLLSQTSAAEFLSGVFHQHSPLYGLHTLLAAFDDPDDLPAPTLECPVRDALDARIWLELAALLARSRGALPGFFYCPGPARLLLTATQPAPSLLAALVDPALASAELWPLTTQNPAAADAARAALLQAIPELNALTHSSVLALWQRLAHAAPELASRGAGA